MENKNLSFLTPLPQVVLNDGGKTMDAWIKAVENNFAAISSLPFLRGDAGLSIYVSYEPLWNEGWTPLGQCIRSLVYHLDDNNESNNVPDEIQKRFDEILKKEYITVNVDDYDGTKYFTVPYTFLDPRRNEIANEDNGFLEHPLEFTDYSCTMVGQFNNNTIRTERENTVYAEENLPDGQIGSWCVTRYHIIPTLYYDDQVGQFCWRVNGEDSHIIAQGVKGDAGRDATLKVITGEKIKQEGGKYIIPISPEQSEGLRPGDVVIVSFEKPDPDGSKGIQFGVIQQKEGGECYVYYEQSQDFISVIKDFQLRGALNKIYSGTAISAETLRGLYIPSINGDTHMFWDNKGQAYLGKVDYNDTAATKTNPTMKSGTLNIGYTQTKAKEIQSTSKVGTVILGDSNINAKYPIVIDKSDTTNTEIAYINGLKSDLAIKETGSLKHTNALGYLTFIPSFEFTIEKTDSLSGIWGPIPGGLANWRIYLPYLGYTLEDAGNDNIIPIYNSHQFTTLNGKNYIDIPTGECNASSKQLGVYFPNVNGKYSGRLSTNIICDIGTKRYKCSLTVVVLDGVHQRGKSEIFDLMSEVFIYIGEYNEILGIGNGILGNINYVPERVGSRTYTWSNISKSNIKTEIDLGDKIFNAGKTNIKPAVRNKNTLILQPFLHFKIYGGADINDSSTYKKLSIIKNKLGTLNAEGKLANDADDLCYPALQWSRMTEWNTNVFGDDTYSLSICPPSPALDTAGNRKGSKDDISLFPHIVFKKDQADRSYILQSGFEFRQRDAAELDDGFAITTQPQNNVKSMILNGVSDGFGYKLYPQGSLYVDDFPVVLDTTMNNKVSYNGDVYKFEPKNGGLIPQKPDIGGNDNPDTGGNDNPGTGEGGGTIITPIPGPADPLRPTNPDDPVPGTNNDNIVNRTRYH